MTTPQNPEKSRIERLMAMGYEAHPLTGLGANELTAFIRVYGLKQTVEALQEEIEAFNQEAQSRAQNPSNPE